MLISLIVNILKPERESITISNWLSNNNNKHATYTINIANKRMKGDRDGISDYNEAKKPSNT